MIIRVAVASDAVRNVKKISDENSGIDVDG